MILNEITDSAFAISCSLWSGKQGGRGIEKSDVTHCYIDKKVHEEESDSVETPDRMLALRMRRYRKKKKAKQGKKEVKESTRGRLEAHEKR